MDAQAHHNLDRLNRNNSSHSTSFSLPHMRLIHDQASRAVRCCRNCGIASVLSIPLTNSMAKYSCFAPFTSRATQWYSPGAIR